MEIAHLQALSGKFHPRHSLSESFAFDVSVHVTDDVYEDINEYEMMEHKYQHLMMGNQAATKIQTLDNLASSSSGININADQKNEVRQFV